MVVPPGGSAPLVFAVAGGVVARVTLVRHGEIGLTLVLDGDAVHRANARHIDVYVAGCVGNVPVAGNSRSALSPGMLTLPTGSAELSPKGVGHGFSMASLATRTCLPFGVKISMSGSAPTVSATPSCSRVRVS